MIGILAEKPSALRNMAAALGGEHGTYNGEQYMLTAARGHLYQLASPELQVDKALKAKYHSWSLENLPWNETDMHWVYTKGKDSDAALAAIQDTLQKCDEVCIATDDDPTGEGELLAWEILDHLNIAPKKWSRMYFVDESAKELQKAFVNRKKIESKDKDPDYIKAFYRSRWDFMSMQFTRIATNCGDGRTTLRQGRLKSAMVVLVGDALKAYNDYQKIPFYQNRFRDENGVIYTDPDEPNYKKKEDVPLKYNASSVTFDGSKMKSTAPPKMLDLASLSARLVGSGYSAKEVSDVYQAMYEAQVVSYPRTEDKVITPEQFNDLLPLVDKIAGVVGVDPSLLTHRTPRATHVKTGGSHGANRPGSNVPASLAALDKFDKKSAGCARAIYDLLAKNYLATLAEDYEYESQSGHVTDYPSFKGTASVPKKMGWKLVYDADADPDAEENAKGIGTQAEPYVHEGFPPRPPYPTMKWLMAQLEKRDVGTGATRTSTYAEVTSSHPKAFPLLHDKKGKISMTELGEMSYQLLPGTHIGSLDITEKVMSDMREIAAGKKDPEVCLREVQKLVLEDIEVMKVNGKAMREARGIMGNGAAERVQGTWKGKDISFKREWGSHRFTDEECEKLLNGEEISFQATSSKDGREYLAVGTLEEQTFIGKDKKAITYFGFKLKDREQDAQPTKERWPVNFNGKQTTFKRNWSDHYFTDEECEKLANGEEISFPAVSKKTGKPYTATGSLKAKSFTDDTGRLVNYVGFDLNTGGGNGGAKDDGKIRIPDSLCQHQFTEDEKQSLEAGLSVHADDFVGKSGNKFSADVHYGQNPQTGKMGLVFEFNK